MQEQQHFWNGVALILFIVFGVLAVAVIARYGTTDFTALGSFDLTLLGLATFRLIHLLTYDKMFAAVRVSFMDGRGKTLRKAARGWRRLMCELLECLWCTGMWSSLFAVTVYCLGWWGRLAIIVLAVAGLGSLFQIASKALAEGTLRDTAR
jgi:hypothetical protein